jgi:hypothetical protein
VSEREYTDSEGRKCDLATMCVREPGWAANRITVSLADNAKLARIEQLLWNNGCDCECDHHSEEHDEDCERCLACRISAVLAGEAS